MMRKMFHLLITAAVLMFILSACGLLTFEAKVVDPGKPAAEATATPPGSAPTSTPATPAETVPTASVATASVATTEPAAPENLSNVTFVGGGFSYDDTLATAAVVETVPANTTGLPGEMVAPEHIEITFDGYVLPDMLHTPQIAIYPVGGLEAVNGRAANEIAALRALLAARPDIPPDGGFEAPALPFLPLFNAGQVLRTGVAYLDFQNGSGVRYLTQFDQAYLPINNDELFYTFQGITADGTLYVSAVLPVSHPSLPADVGGVDEAFIESFDAYILEIAAQLDAQPPDSFTPDLTLLDGMIESLMVGSDGAS
jgi:hypothetical protein